MNNNDQIINLNVNSEWCMESYPCSHIVTLTYKSGAIHKILLNGVQIVEILKQIKKKIPEHFQMYDTI